jgi:hypothetical protein
MSCLFDDKAGPGSVPEPLLLTRNEYYPSGYYRKRGITY